MCMKFRAFLKKGWVSYPNYFRNCWCRKTSKMSCFRTPFDNERVNGFQTLLNSARHRYYPIFSWIRGKFRWKKSALVLSEILRLFVNILTADEKCSRYNMQNLPQQLQTLLSHKENTFSGLFTGFLKCAWILEHFKKTDEYPSLIISEIIDSEKRGYLNV